MLSFSPIVIQRKSAAPPGGSANPFDDFDVFQEPNGIAAGIDALNVTTSTQYSRQFPADSEDDVFGLFSSDTEGAKRSSSPKQKQSQGMKRSGLHKEIRGSSTEDDDEEVSQEDEKPDVPERVPIPESWLQRLREVHIPFDVDDAAMYQFMISPLEEGSATKMTMLYDSVSKEFKLIQDSTSRIVLTAVKRTDGLKALALSANYAIMMMPPDSSLETPRTSYTAALTEPVRIAKLRSNTLCSQYSLFDSGKNPSKAAGVIEMRRELMAVKFETINGVYSRRATYCYLPSTNGIRRPASKDETLAERAKKRDPSVETLSPMMVGTNRLPRVEDFGGFAAVHSVKNILLHDPRTQKVVFRLGRVDKLTYNLDFCRPFSVVSAFALALASYDSKVSPNRQI